MKKLLVVAMATLVLINVGFFASNMAKAEENTKAHYESGKLMADTTVSVVASDKDEIYNDELAMAHQERTKINENDWRRCSGHIDANGIFYGTSVEIRGIAYGNLGENIPFHNTETGMNGWVTYDGNYYVFTNISWS